MMESTENDCPRVVMKFGGSSLASGKRMCQVAELIKSQREHVDPVIVVSAMGKTTNALLKAGEKAVDEGQVRIDEIRTLHLDTLEELDLPGATGTEIRGLLRDLEALLDGVSMVRELTPRTRDLLASFGERLSCRVLAAQLNQIGIPAIAKDAWTIGMRTIGRFGDAVVDEDCYSDLKSSLSPIIQRREVAVVTGFIGKDADGRIVTLGRGGSDLTATALAAACGLDEVQVWKDVDGMMSADPRLVPHAVPVPFATYEEAAELAYFGAQLLHPVSMQPALKANVPVRVKNSYNPDHPGTLIAKQTNEQQFPQTLVTAITTKRRVTLVDVVSTRMVGQSGFLARLFQSLSAADVSVDVVATSEVSVSLTLDKNSQLDPTAIADLSQIAQVAIHSNRAIISLVGDNMKDHSTAVLASCFNILANNGIHVEMISQGASKVNIALVLDDEDTDAALPLLHDCFFLEECKPLTQTKNTTTMKATLPAAASTSSIPATR
mmetsp:Transcript_2974/g.3861  ORF Transcript_2974/g.3861 Transcript_2974/m.3861 type:complete len:493 (-) Transcript_2974:1029-2507(-)